MEERKILKRGIEGEKIGRRVKWKGDFLLTDLIILNGEGGLKPFFITIISTSLSLLPPHPLSSEIRKRGERGRETPIPFHFHLRTHSNLHHFYHT